MPRDPECSACCNLLDLQCIAALKMLDRQIARAWKDGNSVDAALERRREIVEQLRHGPVA